LRASAIVNEVVTSWANPCFYTPISYNVSYWNSGQWIPVLTRQTIGIQSCFSVPGDNGPVAICGDYFANVTASSFLIQFPAPGAYGTVMYEFAIQGIYVDQPYQIATTSWTNPSLAVSNQTITFPSFNLVLLNINGATATYIPQPISIQLRLNRIINGQGKMCTFLCFHIYIQKFFFFSIISFQKFFLFFYNLISKIFSFFL
jgi:hypothetical protein